MNGFTTLWQRVYFNVFAFNKFTQLYVFGFPFLLLLRNKYIKEVYKKRGVADPEKLIKSVLVDRKNSSILWISDTFMCILVVFFVFTIVNLLSALVGVVLMASLNFWVFLTVCLISSMGINYLVLWKNNRYLEYFKIFDKETKSEKLKWAWISFGVVLSIVLLVILSVSTMTKGMHSGDTPGLLR